MTTQQIKSKIINLPQKLHEIFFYTPTDSITWFLATLCFIHGAFLSMMIALPGLFDFYFAASSGLIWLISMGFYALTFAGFGSFYYFRSILTTTFALLNLFVWNFLFVYLFLTSFTSIFWVTYLVISMAAVWLLFRSFYDKNQCKRYRIL